MSAILEVSTLSDNRGDPGGPLLEARGVVCRRGERPLFAALDLALAAGTTTWLRGANGSGKTTLLRALAGLSKPDAGRVRRAAPIVHLGHANALKDDLTVEESLRFLLRLAPVAAGGEPIGEALRRFGLQTRRRAPVRTLSQGLRRRVALARLAALPLPCVWLLDEPYDALDADAVRVLDDLLGEHRRRGGATLLTSHLPFAGATAEIALAAAR